MLARLSDGISDPLTWLDHDIPSILDYQIRSILDYDDRHSPSWRDHYDSHHIRQESFAMPMIDVYATQGTFANKHALAHDLANAVMRWEGVPVISLFQNNTAAFIHDLPADAISNAAGASNYVRVQVLTPVNVLDRDKQLGVVRELTDIVAAAASDPTLVDRTWVLITESPEGGWGINGHANTSDDIVAAARRELSGQ
jgi:phenylpyruvate tautomerase PptA (4-oxalocrotonate tautomerase family)